MTGNIMQSDFCALWRNHSVSYHWQQYKDIWFMAKISHRLVDYWRCDGRQHAALVAAVVLFSAFIFAGYHFGNKKGAAAAAAKRWVKVEARVVSSQIGEVDTSDDSSFSTRLHVRTEFSYSIGGRLNHGKYEGTWTRNDLRDWSDFLRPGNTITIRVSPDDSEKVSLVDYNGIE